MPKVSRWALSCVMKIGTGRLRDAARCVVIVALLFVLKDCVCAADTDE